MHTKRDTIPNHIFQGDNVVDIRSADIPELRASDLMWKDDVLMGDAFLDHPFFTSEEPTVVVDGLRVRLVVGTPVDNFEDPSEAETVDLPARVVTMEGAVEDIHEVDIRMALDDLFTHDLPPVVPQPLSCDEFRETLAERTARVRMARRSA